MRLADFDTLSFDCYGTLIDWETGLLAALQPVLHRAPAPPAPEAVLEEFARVESDQQAATPALRYPDLLSIVHRRLCDHWRIAATDADHAHFGNSVPSWPAFPDSAAALARLKRHYRLVILSNVDRASFAGSAARLGVAFDAVFTAEDIGSYKPDPRNFRFMLHRLGERAIPPNRVLHTAQSLFHDHVPAQRLGLATAWIDRRHDRRGGGATAAVPEAPKPDFRFETLAAMADARDAEG